MPRAPIPAARSTLLVTTAAAAASLFPTLASGGYVPVGACDVASQPRTQPSQVLVIDPLAAQAAARSVHLGEAEAGRLVDEAATGAPGRISRTDEPIDAFAPDPLVGKSVPVTGALDAVVAEGMPLAIGMDRPVAVPLPVSLWAGIVGLATAAWATRRDGTNRRAKGRTRNA